MERLSIVIPCYGSQQSIASVVAEVVKTAEARRDEYEYEIVLVSDASPDNVFAVIEALAKENPRIKGIELAKNFGQHAALMAGYRHCTGDIVISMDDDGQTPADEMFLLVDKLNEGYDVVYAQYPEIRQSWFRRWGSAANKVMMEQMLGKPKDIVSNSYFACKRFIIEEMIRYRNPYPYLGGLVFRATKKIGSVMVHHRARQDGKSGYTIKKLLSLWFNGFTTFSIKPLRIATALGVLVAVIGFVAVIWVFVNKLVTPDVPLGYSSTLAVLLLVGGMLMLMLGMVGEYIGRIYISINDAPQYVIRDMVNVDTASQRDASAE